MQFNLFANAASQAISSLTGIPSKRDTLFSPSKENIQNSRNTENSDEESPLKVFLGDNESNQSDKSSSMITPFSFFNTQLDLSQDQSKDSFQLKLSSVPEVKDHDSEKVNELSALMDKFYSLLNKGKQEGLSSFDGNCYLEKKQALDEHFQRLNDLAKEINVAREKYKNAKQEEQKNQEAKDVNQNQPQSILRENNPLKQLSLDSVFRNNSISQNSPVKQQKSFNAKSSHHNIKLGENSSPCKDISNSGAGAKMFRSPLKKGVSSPVKKSCKENSENGAPCDSLKPLAKENSPLKKKRKQTNNANLKSPLKSSPLKSSPIKKRAPQNQQLVSNIGSDLRQLVNSPLKQSPVKQQQETVTEPKEQQPDPIEEAKKDLKLKDTTCKNIFSRKKMLRQQQNDAVRQQPAPVDINSVLKLDAFTMNFGSFVSGKMLGSTIELTNLTDKDQVFQLSLDSKNKSFPIEKVFKNEGKSDLDTIPFTRSELSGSKEIANSELTDRCWFMEDPYSKKLEKSICVRIDPAQTLEVVVVVKTPMQKVANLASFIQINHITTRQEKRAIEKQLRASRNGELPSLEVKETVVFAPNQTLEVLVSGKLLNHDIKCLKEVYDERVETSLIPLVVKKSQGVQKFRIPFKNLTRDSNAEVEFMFIKSQQPQLTNEAGKTLVCLNMVSAANIVTFFCQPGPLNVTSTETNFLNVQVKVDTEKIQECDEQSLSKLLIARIKGTNLIRSFFVHISLVNQ